jgi:DnaJ-class molecular chaperone
MTAQTVLVLTVPLAVAGYLAACRWWPYAACWRCHGDGKKRSPTGRAWRPCKRCKGTGTRLRIGRRILNRWSEAAARGHR